MKKLSTLFFLSFLMLGSLFAENWGINSEDGGWNDRRLATLYVHNSEPQTQLAWEVFSKCGLRGDEHILDFGCGDGKLSALISFMVPNGEVIGVDLSEQMIWLAGKMFTNHSYGNLTFQQSKDLNFATFESPDKFDIVVSFCVFHLIPNPLEVLTNIRKNMSSNGKLILTLPLKLCDLFTEVVFEEMKLRGWPLPTSQGEWKQMKTEALAREIISQAGFEIRFCESFIKDQIYGSRGEFVDWLEGTLTANWSIPRGCSREFFETVVNRYLELSPLKEDEDGFVYLDCLKIDIVASNDG